MPDTSTDSSAPIASTRNSTATSRPGTHWNPAVITSPDPSRVADQTAVTAIGTAAIHSEARPRGRPSTAIARTTTTCRASRSQINRPG